MMGKKTCKNPNCDCAERARDPEAWFALVAERRPLIVWAIRKQIPSLQKADCDDLAHDIMLHIFGSIEKWKRECTICSWISLLASHKVIDFSRSPRRRRPPGPLVSEPIDHRAPEESAEDPNATSKLDALKRVYETIDATDQFIFTQWANEIQSGKGMKVSDIAHRLKMSERTVFGRLAKIKTLMKKARERRLD